MKVRRSWQVITSLANSFKQALGANPEIQKLVSRHPRLFAWLRARVDRRHFYGLPLTLLAVAFGYLLFLLLGVIQDVLTSDVVVSVDVRLADLLYVLRSPALLSVFLWLTLLGKWPFIFTVTLVVSIWLWIRHRRLYIIPLWIVVLGSEVFVSLAKLVFHRARPDGALAAYRETSFSFPSNHATLSMAVYGFLAYIIWRTSRRWASRIWTIAAATIVIALIGFSRLYLGVHFFSDVWGGYVIGALWLVIGISVLEWLLSGNSRQVMSRALDNRTKKIGTGLLLAVLIFYIGYALVFRPQLRLLRQPAAPAVTISTRSLAQTFTDQHLPTFTETIAGTAEEPINVVILADNEQQLIETFAAANWYRADTVTGRTLREAAKAAWLNRPYNTAPVTPSFWNATVHDFAFEKPAAAETIRQRHHARFWQTNLVTAAGKHVYVGTASYDTQLKWLVTHRIEPAIDTERSLLVSDLVQSGAVAGRSQQTFVRPTLGKNFAGDYFFTDGQVAILELR